MIKGAVFILGSCFPIISRNLWVAITPRFWLELDLLLESVTELKARMCNTFLKDYSCVLDAVDSVSVVSRFWIIQGESSVHFLEILTPSGRAPFWTLMCGVPEDLKP